MFNPFKSEAPAASKDTTFSVSEDLRLAIEDAGLTDDAAVKQMIETGFVSPNGTEHDPFEFIAQRKALVEAGESGASAPEIREDQKVSYSAGEGQERKLSDIDA